MTELELYHHGILGQKWGVRRYQNKDGSLTSAGKKRISKEYKKVSDKVTKDLEWSYSSRYVKAYNDSANYMNNGGIDKFNSNQRKKYGEKYADREGYMDDYMKNFDDLLAKNYNKSLNEFYKTNKNYQKSKELVDKYEMTKWDDLAKSHAEMVEEVRRMVEG